MRATLQGQVVGLEEPGAWLAALASAANPRAVQEQLVAFVGGHVDSQGDRLVEDKTPSIGAYSRWRLRIRAVDPGARPAAAREPDRVFGTVSVGVSVDQDPHRQFLSFALVPKRS